MKNSALAATGALKDSAFTQYANAALPKRAAISSGLEAYTGTWDKRHASHLLRRTLFGFTPADLTAALANTASTCVDALLAVPAETIAPPVVVDSRDTVPLGQTWVTAAQDGTVNAIRIRSFQDWWMGLIANQGFSIREKMVLFWHNHFPSELGIIADARYGYAQNVLMRNSAVGNFKQLVKQISIDPAMLQYLNGDSNTNTNPNENFGRELQELFTIGKGPEISAGNYTNYTEDDVKAAARVMTGWRDVKATVTSEFRPNLHDATDKTFSSAYGGKVIAGRAGADGALELDDLMNLIFAQAETAKYICRKLYRFFVYYAIDASVESNMIAPMADLLIKSSFEIKPVLSALLKSAHFHDPLNMGCAIKTPLDHVVGTLRQMGIALPDNTNAPLQYTALDLFVGESARMQQEIGNPPNVAGWPAYYQDPVYYEIWINSDTLPRRVQLTDKLASNNGYAYTSGTDKLAIVSDVIALAQGTSKPDDVVTLIAELSLLFFPIDLTAVQLKYLKDILLAGVPDYEWGTEWDDYAATPTDAVKKAAVETRLRALLQAMMEMAEYQLC